MTRNLSILSLLTLVTCATSLEIHCRVRDRYLDITKDGFECEIVNQLQITARKSKIDSVRIVEVVPSFEEEANDGKSFEEYFKEIDGNLTEIEDLNDENLTENENLKFKREILANFSTSNFDNFEDNSTIEFSHLDFTFTALIAFNNSLNFIPSNISFFFPNLTLLAIINSNLLEIRRQDFFELQNLRALWLPYNKIEVLEWNLFDFTPHLEQLILTENRIRHINLNAFDAVKNLNHLGLIANFCINRVAVTSEDVREMMEILSEKCNIGCNCEIYFIVAIGIGIILSALAVLFVLKRRD